MREVCMKRILESKLTTAIALIILLTPFLVFGFILYRDSSQTGEPVVGSRFESGLNPEIKKESLELIEKNLDDERFINKKVVLKSATLRIYLEVKTDQSKEVISDLAQQAYEITSEVLPIETYFTSAGSRKQYDLEINIYNNADRESEEFIYYQIMKHSTMETLSGTFLTDVKDPEFRDEVLENLAEKEKALTDGESEGDGEDSESEEDKDGE